MTISEDLIAASATCDNAVDYIATLQADLTAAEEHIDAQILHINELLATAVQRDEIIVCLSDKVEELEAELELCDCPEPDPVEVLRGQHLIGAVAKPGTLAAFATMQGIVGNDAPMESRRIFLSGDLDWTVDTAAGRVPIVEVPLGISTEDLDEVVAIAQADDLPVVFTIGHEEERPDKNQTPEYFKGEVARIAPVLKQAPKAVVIVTYMGGSARGIITGVDIQDWLPPATDLHGVGFDIYCGNPLNQPYNSLANVVNPSLQIAGQLGLPLFVPEFGVGGPVAERSAYVQSYLDLMAGIADGTITVTGVTPEQAALITIWFNSNIGGNPPATPFGNTWDIDKGADGTDTLTPAIWREAILL